MSRIAVLALVVLVTAFCPGCGLAILVTTGRPIFYTQERVGQGGRLFRIIKFRQHALRCRTRDRTDLGVRITTAAAPGSATGCGTPTSTSCRSSLTCFKGEMSLVGPRPERPNFVDRVPAARCPTTTCGTPFPGG